MGTKRRDDAAGSPAHTEPDKLRVLPSSRHSRQYSNSTSSHSSSSSLSSSSSSSQEGPSSCPPSPSDSPHPRPRPRTLWSEEAWRLLALGCWAVGCPAAFLLYQSGIAGLSGVIAEMFGMRSAVRLLGRSLLLPALLLLLLDLAVLGALALSGGAGAGGGGRAWPWSGLVGSGGGGGAGRGLGRAGSRRGLGSTPNGKASGLELASSTTFLRPAGTHSEAGTSERNGAPAGARFPQPAGLLSVCQDPETRGGGGGGGGGGLPGPPSWLLRALAWLLGVASVLQSVWAWFLLLLLAAAAFASVTLKASVLLACDAMASDIGGGAAVVTVPAAGAAGAGSGSAWSIARHRVAVHIVDVVAAQYGYVSCLALQVAPLERLLAAVCLRALLQLLHPWPPRQHDYD